MLDAEELQIALDSLASNSMSAAEKWTPQRIIARFGRVIAVCKPTAIATGTATHVLARADWKSIRLQSGLLPGTFANTFARLPQVNDADGKEMLEKPTTITVCEFIKWWRAIDSKQRAVSLFC